MRSYDIVVDVTLLDRSEVQPLCLRDGAAGARTVTAMKNQTSVTAARLRTYWWPFLAFALLALPMFGMRELFRVHRPYTPSASRLLTVFIIFELLAMFGLLTEHLTLRKLFSEANIARDRLHLAMTSGRSMGWEWDLESGRDYWLATCIAL